MEIVKKREQVTRQEIYCLESEINKLTKNQNITDMIMFKFLTFYLQTTDACKVDRITVLHMINEYFKETEEELVQRIP